ncbi:hypothetical protein [Aurantiacibacter spongiae]|uniref:Uncharacterized protein n=1 Tax=Aurantiacibacter spongiae TaxID=2488860 RepID=A0A3N5CWW1_9SPHN|nr:hypothetical protein [Aurantiacibacter spongiae]RPF72050.1 hypothetical protein EG799_10810 [Aurantiacibacter spongiae]
MVIDPRDLFRGRAAEERASDSEAAPVLAPLSGTRAQRIQRLQVGLFGIGAMVLLVGLADIVITRAQQTSASAVPEAAPTVVATETASPRDPLADAGVAPELPAETDAPAAQPPARGGEVVDPDADRAEPLRP